MGDPILREETKLVETITPNLRQLIDDMFETMYAARGIGLAAPQVGRNEMVAVVDVEKNALVLINPQILASGSATEKDEEGCLSIPDIYADVERPLTVKFRAMDRDGSVHERDADGLFARCVQHEIDHLHGKLFIDYLSVLKRRSALAKWGKEKDKYPGFVRRLEEDPTLKHEHPDEEL